MLLQHFQFRRAAIAIANLLALMCAARALAQDYEVLCSDGNGTFQTATLSGVTVKVGATKSGGLSTRSCEATLAWNKQPVTIATNAAQIDLDAFNVDLGLGVPIAAFQVKNSATQCCMEYKLYSLDKSPRLLRTLTGGDYFSAADTDLDGRVEIWTTDAAAVNGFERLNLAELDSAPTIVLRFEHGDLHDVSSEFQPYYDNLIADLRKQLGPSDLQEFKNTDGKLSGTAPPAAGELHRQRQSKIKVLEIVWSFLYSGREPQAWSALSDLWPAADIPRIRAALTDARAQGLLTQIAGGPAEPAKRKKHATIFDAETQSSSEKTEVTPPEPILLRRPPPPEISNEISSPSELILELTIDSAGKVRSAEPAGKTKSMDPALLQATTEWKFIPALKAGRPVASRTRMAVSLRQ